MPPPPHSPPDSFTKHSASSNEVNHNAKPEPASIDGDDNQFAELGVGRSSSEEKESMTPAQSKRKAQNRAAYVVSHAEFLVAGSIHSYKCDFCQVMCKTDKDYL